MLTEFIGNLACPLEFGHTLIIVGKTIDGATRFYINLRTGKQCDKSTNIGLNFSCRFRNDTIGRNAQIDGDWGEEETDENLDENSATNPIVAGDFFMVCIFANEEKFHIAVNNRPFCTFKYRIPLGSIRTLEIREHIQTIKQIDHRTVFPYAWPPIHSTDPPKAFSNDIPILFAPGHVIVIRARCFGNPKGQFIIKFMKNFTLKEELHFNVRFDQNQNQNPLVVRNAMKSNFEFGHEERDGGFPFKFDQQFNLAIAFGESEFFFAVDGFKFTTFAYRSVNLLQDLVGFKVTCLNGLKIHITGLDHIQTGDPNCRDFENFSRHDIDIL